MKINVLLSAMHLSDYKYINTLNITSDCVVINQCDENEQKTLVDSGRKIEYISTTERGLSRSRNKAIIYSNADICILCDNDVEYLDNYKDTILMEHMDNKDIDIIVFFVEKIKGSSKPIFNKEYKIGYLTALKVSSVEITFKRESIINSGVLFNEHFGAGARFSMGEENIFLYDCLKAGLKIKYVPKKIASLRDVESTWFKGYTDKFLQDRGAIFYEMTNKFYIFLVLQFAVRKHKYYKDSFSFFEAITMMFQGKEQYKKLIKKKAAKL